MLAGLRERMEYSRLVPKIGAPRGGVHIGPAGAVTDSRLRHDVFFFFSSRRRHTRLQGDWSSDVCSSDLRLTTELPESAMPLVPKRWGELNTITIAFGHGLSVAPLQATMAVGALMNGGTKIGRASCRERV